MKKSVIVSIIFLLSISILFSAEWDMISKIVASDRGYDDFFSTDVAISGNYAIGGAYREDQSVDEGGTLVDAGAAYIFRFDGSEWVQMQKLVAPTRAADDLYGYSVDICGDYAIIGSHQEDVGGVISTGAAYIYHFDGTSWTMQDKLLAIDREIGDHLGYSVALTEDKAVVGAVYEDDNVYGTDSIATAGSAYVFSRSGSTWTQQAKLVPDHRAEDNRFGFHVAISGSYILVSSPYEDMDADSLDYEVSAGAAYVFYNDGGNWTQQQKLVASDRNLGDYFGYRADIDGSTIVVGAYMEDHDADGLNYKEKAGSVYIFDRSGSVWSETQKIVASERWVSDFFGHDVAIEDDMLIVGTRGEDHDTLATNYIENAGAAYIFRNVGGNWTEQEKITESNRRAEDAFGTDVAISGDVVLVSAPANDLDEDELNLITSAGAAYIFSTGIGGIISPEIMVKGNDIEIMNGDNTPSLADHTNFGITQISAGTIVKTYTISNAGTGNLLIDSIYVHDSWGVNFVVSTSAPGLIAPGTSGDFSISFTPSNTSLRVGTVNIESNDPDEDPYTFAIQGQGKTPYSGGSGTEADPFIIATYDDLIELSAMTHDWDKYFSQTDNIDMAGTDSLNIGDHDGVLETAEVPMGFSPIGDSPTSGDRQEVAFSGSYNGNGYTISNLYINRPEEGLIGFFGYVKDVSHTQKTAIKSINLLDIDINGHGYTGGLVGWNLDASIDSCSVNGNVTSLGGTVGGLVGFDQDIITACHSLCVVSGGTAGGLVGYKEFGKIINSSSRDMVQSPSGTAGGVVGSMYQAEIQNTQASGSVTGYRYTGGFAGSIQYRSKITNCYVRSDVTGSAPSAYNATGGFCGYVNGWGVNLGSNIENCYSTSLVHYNGIADPTDRGFVGTVALTNTFINNFFVVTSSSQLADAVGAATPKDSIAMSDATTFTDISIEGLTSAWDFAYNFNDDAGDEDIWDMDTSGALNDGYPFLFWENGDDIALQEEVGVDDIDIIEEFLLAPAYPNPFNPKTVISVQYAVGSNSTINIYNIQGKLVDRLFHGYVEIGTYELTWDASNMPSGVYVVKMTAGDFVQSQKVVLLK
jgi:FG-GAP repeat protein/type IX secretion system substrate protein/HYDIN/CFA65/VesB family protein/GLUG motif-containing protein